MIDDIPPPPCGHRLTRAAPMFHRIFPADPQAVRQALVDLRARFTGAVPSDAVDRMELAMAEVLNNIVQHGGAMPHVLPVPPGAQPPAPVTIHLTVTRHAGGLACAVTDDGGPLPLCCLTPAQMPLPEIAALREGGFGWFMIRDLTQSLFYFRERRRNVLCFSVPPAEGGQRPAGTTVVA
ncbi:ATP-binding protein [Paracoccus alkenifer]|uniref:Serine/threonine-protein kinase RsbW n=1 Tax=Paracoccus alkenifer TaxID=65735 RepID=A0A1H6MAI3_9RHOB|nr:ATP-binding protein [Paracoccus alkenifer]SEH95919.1 serine/threonine-protein kinase RsbW [Paracoccus alkenifer]